jgi:hypothetical protein
MSILHARLEAPERQDASVEMSSQNLNFSSKYADHALKVETSVSIALDVAVQQERNVPSSILSSKSHVSHSIHGYRIPMGSVHLKRKGPRRASTEQSLATVSSSVRRHHTTVRQSSLQISGQESDFGSRISPPLFRSKPYCG